MAQTGYTPILIYSSSTTTNAPAVGNLTNSTLGSELAINITDGKLFYKDNANAIQVIAWKVTPTSAGGTGLTSYTAGDLLYYATGTTLAKLAIGASTTVLTSSGSAPQWTAQSSLAVGTASNLKSNATTGVMQIVGPAAAATRVMTIPDANFTAARTDAGQTFTGSQTFLIPDNGGLSMQQTGASQTGYFNFVSSASVTAGRISYDHSNNAMRFATNQTEKMRLSTTGGLNLGGTSDPGAGNFSLTGNVIIDTSGKGIDFSATTGAGISELLADYEEGTWTTTVSDGTTSVAGGTSWYIKIGKQVTCGIAYYSKNISGLAASGLRITGLPYANNGTYGSATNIYASTGSTTSVGAFVSGSDTYALLYLGSSGPNASALTKSSFNDSTQASLWGTIIYYTA